MASVLLIVCAILLYLSLPAVLLWEARRRQARYGHALPRRTQKDAERGRASAARLEKTRSQVLAKDAVDAPASPADSRC